LVPEENLSTSGNNGPTHGTSTKHNGSVKTLKETGKETIGETVKEVIEETFEETFEETVQS